MKGARWSWLDFFTSFIVAFIIAFIISYAVSRAYVTIVDSKEGFTDLKSCGDSC
jgi:hypothetical protein